MTPWERYRARCRATYDDPPPPPMRWAPAPKRENPTTFAPGQDHAVPRTAAGKARLKLKALREGRR